MKTLVKFLILHINLLLFSQVVKAELLLAPQVDNGDHWKTWISYYQSIASSHSQYICEHSFRSIANHVIDPASREFHPDAVMPGDVIYVAVCSLEWFAENAHDKILNPYILITCDTGGAIPYPSKNQCKLLFDPKVACWFAKNMLFTNHPKLFQLPMGQWIHLWIHSIVDRLTTLDRLVGECPHQKENLLYLNYSERDHGRRISVADQFWNKTYCLNRNRPFQRLSFEDYWLEIAKSKFVLSPLGLEVDCTRTWECFILGAIPIVEHSYLDPLYDELPILLIHNWDEINEEFLNQKFIEISNQSYNVKKAFMDYWISKLVEKQKQIRCDNYESSTLEASLFTPTDTETLKEILHKTNKLSIPIVYRGNLTGLRPFQFVQEIPSIPFLWVYDVWSKTGFSWMKQFCKNYPVTLNSDKIVLCDIPSSWNTPQPQIQRSFFLDLTHHRHSLFLLGHGLELADFCHSLEKSIADMYNDLKQGELLFGNMFNDSYVNAVLMRLQKSSEIRFQSNKNFWYCLKR